MASALAVVAIAPAVYQHRRTARHLADGKAEKRRGPSNPLGGPASRNDQTQSLCFQHEPRGIRVDDQRGNQPNPRN